MGTHFIVDKRLKERRETIQEILRLTQKSPYPNKETTHLATFIKACFFEAEEKKKHELFEKERRVKAHEDKIRKELFAKEEAKAMSELEGEIPAPPGDEIVLLAPEDESPVGKREYVLRIYENPVGVLVDKNERGNYVYNVVEPVLADDIIDYLKDKYGRSLLSNHSLFNGNEYFKKLAMDASKKFNVPMGDMLARKIKYYLEKDILGGGKFDPFILDERVKGIICEGVNQNIKVDYLDFGEIKSNVVYRNTAEINKFMRRVAMAAGKKLDDNNPILDVVFQGLKFEGVIGVGGKSSKLSMRRI
jgi:hypothetical protein